MSQPLGAELVTGNGESVLYGTDGLSDAAFADPTNQIID